jgi:translocation and assembly module TamA
MLRYVLISFILCAPLAALDYSVEFEGLRDRRALSAVESIAQLVTLKKRPPNSLNALRYRADSDIPVILKVLQAHGYYEAKVQIQIQPQGSSFEVFVVIDPGPLYTIESYDVHVTCSQGEVCCPMELKKIGVKLGSPARIETILNAELKVLTVLGECGYPLSEIQERSIVVDGKTKTVRVEITASSLARCTFGNTTIVGENKVKPAYIERKMFWKEGETYNSHLVEETQTALINSGLFNSVLITHEPTPTDNNELPMKIEVTENKYQSINVGVSYQTFFGPGLTGGWEHRNLSGMGRRLSIQGDVTRISQTGIATYIHPDAYQTGGDFIAEGEAAHEKIFAYSMRSYSESNRFDSYYGKRIRFSVGIEGERLFVTDSKVNGEYWLAHAPLYVRWSTANNLLNPTKGVKLEGLIIPSIAITEGTQFYATQEITEAAYFPLTKDHKLVLAEELSIGMSWYHTIEAVPLPKRFLGGSEQELRGYRYRTVSPLIGTKPIGGGSSVYGTLEARFRVSSTIGFVPFFDIGNVYLKSFPTWDGKWFKSVGLGLRYFTFMGPFRLDVAFPLNRRKGIDPVYKILVSIGQTF